LTGVLAMLALVTGRRRALFWLFVIAFNIIGITDFIVDYIHGVQVGLPNFAGQLGFGYAIVILYVPALMLTHLVAFYLMTRSQTRSALHPATAH